MSKSVQATFTKTGETPAWDPNTGKYGSNHWFTQDRNTLSVFGHHLVTLTERDWLELDKPEKILVTVTKES